LAKTERESSQGADERGKLLERSHQLSELNESLTAVTAESTGRLVLVSGEAGVGKTVLLRRFCGQAPNSTPILWAACDGLLTPGPLGPFFDLAEVTRGELEEVVSRGGRPHEVTAALIRELSGGRPTVVVLEDLHWADEATLDVLRLLARKVESVPAFFLASYRDDQLDRTHPLTLVLGELATATAVTRLEIPPLSPGAVAELAAPHGIDAENLYRQTSGNSFFVAEVLAAGTGDIPRTVREAVLARVARLSDPARRLLEAIAVATPQAEIRLLEALAPAELDRLEECMGSGMVASARHGVSFRHELARLAVEESISPDRRLWLHRRAAEALAATLGATPDLARLAHHAEAAGDGEAVLRFAPSAAARAASLGAHREAAAQYARALRFADALSPQERAELLEKRAYECYVTGGLEEAIGAQNQALELRRQLDDRRAEGDCLRSLSRLYRFLGRTREAADVGREAIARLERLPPSRELALAYVNLGHLYAVAEDVDESMAWSSKALALGEELGDPEVIAYALTNIGANEVQTDSPEAPARLEQSLELALRAGLDENAGRAYLNLVWWPVRQRRYDLVERYIQPGIEYCAEHGMDLWRLFFIPCRARLELDRGQWEGAAESAASVLRDPRVWPVPRVFALTVLGLVRARRGDPGFWPLLDEAFELAEPTGELQRIGPVAAARTEAAWLEGRQEAVAVASEAGLELAIRRRASWTIGELACWRRRAGIEEDVEGPVAEPYAAELAGDPARAAELWGELGCPYDAALALAGADDEELQRRALDELRRLGAQPAAAIVARRLRERGARGVPRGPRAQTRENPAGLTAREVEVLELVAHGLRNADIAQRLFLSEKTVGHHVSAILRKLDVQTRGEASAEAQRLGLAGQDR
jgi:DNA-binding CsgD family transcriptional regulator/tetratricopeptide (TPR) repeat protein